MEEIYREFLFYAGLLWRRRWYAVAVTLFTCIAGWVTVAFIPDTYTSSGRIYVDTRSILQPLLSGLAVESDVGSEIRLMEQTLLSRPNLEEVARRTDLDITAKSPEQMETLVKSLRERTAIGSGQSSLFSISFEDTNPQRAKDVVTALFNLFVESNLGASRKDMDAAHRFLDDQIQQYERLLEQAEQRLAVFKQENMGLLPGEGGYRSQLEIARTTLATAQADLKDAETERDVLRHELDGTPEMLEYAANGGFGSGPPSDTAYRMLELQSELDKLRLKFTDKHPDVIALHKVLDDLRAQYEQELQTPVGPGGDAAGGNDGGGWYGIPNPVYSQLRLQLVERESRIATLKERIARLQTAYQDIDAKALAVPQVEAQLVKLNRDYDVLRSKHGELLGRRESAKLSRDREATGEKVQFRIVDPPQVPLFPSGPNRPLLLSAVVPIGLGAGIGFALVLALLADTFADSRRLKEALKMPVLGTVTLIEPARHRLWKVAEVSAFSASLLFLGGIYAVLMAVESQVGLGSVASLALSTKSLNPVLTMLSEALSNVLSTGIKRI